MPSEKSPQVLIVGAGPVGLFAAICLTRRGIPVEIVDTGVWACQHSYALALHPQTLGIFKAHGLLERVLESAHAVHEAGFYDGASRRAVLPMEGPDAPSACLAVLRQDALEALLEKQLQQSGVTVAWRHDVSRLEPGDAAVSASIDRLEKESRGYVVAHTEWVVTRSSRVDVPFVIGADGYNSRVRRTLGLDFAESGPAQYYAVFEFTADAEPVHEVRIVLGDRTTDVLWPLPGGAFRWSFELPDYADQEAERVQEALRKSGHGDLPSERIKDRTPGSAWERLPELEDSHLRQWIAERAPWFNAEIKEVSWRTIVRFERRLASAFGRGRMWLAGDAAHLTGPAGIQSMNAGLAEAHDLASTLASILKDGAPLEKLGAYNDRWMAVWRRLHGMDGGLHARPSTDPWLASHAGQILSALPAHGPALATLAGRLGFDAG